MKINFHLKWIYILSFLFILSCKGQNKDDQKNSVVQQEKVKDDKPIKDELFNGKIFYSGDELNHYTFVISSDINKSDSLTYSIYKKNSENIYVFSIEKLIANTDQEKYKITDLVTFNDYSPGNTKVTIKAQKNGYTVELNNKNKIVKTWFLEHNTAIEPYDNYLSLLLHSYIKEGVNAKNIVSTQSKATIESIISKYWHQPDFYKDSFFKRESKVINSTISTENMEVWKLCNEKLDFTEVAASNELESDWRYPYKNIKSLNIIYNLFSDSSYGDSFEGQTLPQQMALYMYFLPWKQRKAIYEEIDKLKTELKQKQ